MLGSLSSSIPTLFLLLNLFIDGISGDLIDSLTEESERAHRQRRLSCQVCHSETNENCNDLTHWDDEDAVHSGFSQQCWANQTACQVKMFAYTLTSQNGTTSKRPFGVKRLCAMSDKCQNGCVIMGERIKLYICSTCCYTDNCNTGSGVDRVQLIKGLILGGILVFFFNHLPISAII